MIDFSLTLYLILILPAMQLWVSSQQAKGVKKSRMERYLKTIAKISISLAAVATSFWWTGRSAAQLGLDIPVSQMGQWGLLGATLILTTLGISMLISELKSSEEKREKFLAEIKSNDALPRTSTELITFFLFSLFVGIGWEILYRGFLLSTLSPITGITVAIILSAVAYGAAHGYQNPRQFAGSIVSAFIFTIAFAFTKSLWWLMVIHVGLPLLSALVCYKKLRTLNSSTANEHDVTSSP